MLSSVGVLVSCKRGSEDPTLIHCSGIQLYNSGWVLTTGTVFGEQLSENETRILRGATRGLRHIPTHSPDMASSSTFSVTSQAAATGDIDAIPVKAQQTKSTFVNCPTWVKRKASLEYVWRCPLVIHAMENILHASSWDLGGPGTKVDDTEEECGNDEQIRMQLSVFVLLKVPNEQGEDWDVKRTLQNWFLDLDCVHRGQNLYIESTPFGNVFFLNSLSSGVISNIIGPSGCLMLTDAHSAQGSEGAPMVSISHLSTGKVAGMVLTSLSWWRGEWVGFTLGASLKPIICNLFYLLEGIPSPLTADTPIPSHRCVVDEAVVMVRAGTDSWGSGVVVDAASGIVLTCSHVVNKAGNDTLSVFCNGKFMKHVSLLYVNRSTSPYDLAVLRVSGGLLKQNIRFSVDPPKRGDIVWTAGFPLLSERDEPNLKPTLSRGVVSRVLGVNGPAMFHTTCCVQSGMSGGPVLREGLLLGLMACHTHSVDSGARFPHINMAIPTAAFEKTLLKFLRTSDVSCLRDLETNNKEVQHMWRLKDVPGSKL